MQITNIQTWKILKTLSSKNSSGFDMISPKIVKTCAETLAPPLTLIINKCFETGQFPSTLKLAKITPIHKKGNREPGNFRPISQLSTFSKVIEKAAHAQLNNYLETNYEDMYQFAYRNGHSTVHPMILTRHLIEQHLKKNEFVLLVMIDLSLAFDCIETNEILIEKLRHYGATNLTCNFFKNFFTNRKHYVDWLGETSSNLELNNHSCVQGSCLGAPIFNLYTKELPKITDNTIISFADDTNLILASQNLDELIEKGNEELEKISQYMSANSLLINTKKTQALIFRPKNKPNKENPNKYLKMNGELINIVKTAKYLGIIFDNKLNFKPQFKNLEKKLKSTIYALLPIRKLLTTKAKNIIYNSLFKSNLDYGSVTYQDKLKNFNIQKLMKLQKMCIRLIFNARPGIHTKKLFEISKITPASETYTEQSIKMLYKSLNQKTKTHQPTIMNKIINDNIKPAGRTRLSQDTNKIPLNLHNQDSLMYQVIKKWNETSPDIKNSGNINALTKAFKTHAIQNLPDCILDNCWNCNLDRNVDYVKKWSDGHGNNQLTIPAGRTVN